MQNVKERRKFKKNTNPYVWYTIYVGLPQYPSNFPKRKTLASSLVRGQALQFSAIPNHTMTITTAVLPYNCDINSYFMIFVIGCRTPQTTQPIKAPAEVAG